MPRKQKHDVIDLLKALRAEGIVCSTVSVGAVSVDGIRWLTAEDARDKKPEPRLSHWEQQVEALQRMPASANTDVPPETLIE